MHDGVEDGAQAVVLRTSGLDDLLEDFAVGELEVGSGVVDEEFADDVAGDLVAVIKEDAAVIVHVAKCPAVGSGEPLLHVGTTPDLLVGIVLQRGADVLGHLGGEDGSQENEGSDQVYGPNC